MRTTFSRIFFVVLLCLAVSAPAQEITGTISGTVRDESGAVMPGVKVSVHNTATGLERSALSGDNGGFRIPALPFGPYELKAGKQGFQTTVVQDIALAVGQVQVLDLVMKVGVQAQEVTVTGAVEMVNAETSKLGGVVDHRNAVEMPLNGRDFTQLARLQAGVAASGGGGGQQGGVSNFSSNGQRSDSNNFLVDGIDNNNYLAGSVAQLPSIDSIQEFEVQTNTFAAEYGRNSGAIINLVTRAGTNDLHSVSCVYQLPLKKLLPGAPVMLAEGWELGGILTLQSGQPFSVLTGAGTSGTSEGADRPDVIGDPNQRPKTANRFFNTAVFQLNKPLTFGNSGRNILAGPNFRNFDFSILKNTKIGERFNAQFRAEFFNLTNHPNFAIPSNVLTAANFGALFQTPDVAQNNVGLGSGGPRLIQFGLKLVF